MVQGVMHLLILSMLAHLTKELGPGGRVQNGLPGGAETERLHHQACGQAHQHNSQACHRLPGALTEADEARVEYSE